MHAFLAAKHQLFILNMLKVGRLGFRIQGFGLYHVTCSKFGALKILGLGVVRIRTPGSRVQGL